MSNLFEFPVLNPLRVIWQTEYLQSNVGTQFLHATNPAFNTLPFDTGFSFLQVKYFQRYLPYAQPYQQSDTIRMQFLGSSATAGHYQARLILANGAEFTNKTVSIVQETGTWSGMKLYTIEIKLWDVPEGFYFLQLRHNSGSGNTYVLHEPIDVRQVHEHTIRLDYKNSVNHQSVIYPSSSYIMQIRLRGFVSILPPEAEFYVYTDQPLNKELVSGTPSRLFEMNALRCPEWMADKLNRIFLCDTVNIDGVSYTRDTGSKLEPVNADEASVLSDYKIKLGERYNTSTVPVQDSVISLGNMPQTNYFWVEEITLGSPITIQKMFRGKRNFLDFLNSTYLVSAGYFAEDDNGKLIFVLTSDQVLAGTYALLAANVLPYGVRFLLNGAGDFDVHINSPSGTNFYAVVWGESFSNINKTALANTPSTTNIAKTYSSSKSRECFVFFSNGHSMADAATSVDCLEIGGDLPPGMVYFIPMSNNPRVQRFENNIFKYVTAMVDFDIQGYSLDTYAINDLIRWIYDTLTKWSTSAIIVISSQFNPAPPSTYDVGIKRMVSEIASRVTTLTTD